MFHMISLYFDILVEQLNNYYLYIFCVNAVIYSSSINILTQKGRMTMKKKFKMDELDCANCAAKMEALIKKIPGVNDASISFMMQKLTIDADDARFEEIMEEAQKACTSVDSACKIIR